MPFQPCFNLLKTSNRSFRGSVSGLGFAACDFNRRGGFEVATATALPDNEQVSAPLSLRSTLSTSGSR